MSAQFFHNHLGRHLIGAAMDSEYVSPHKIFIPHRCVKGVMDMNLGQIGITYMCSAEGSAIVGRLEYPSSTALQIVRSEDCSANKYLAQWLLAREKANFMVGVIGKGAAESSFIVSHAMSRTFICDSKGSELVNLNEAKNTLALLNDSDVSWKVFAPALHTYSEYRLSRSNVAKVKLNKMFIKTPQLRNLLQKSRLMPNCGEYRILSWYHIER